MPRGYPDFLRAIGIKAVEVRMDVTASVVNIHELSPAGYSWYQLWCLSASRDVLVDKKSESTWPWTTGETDSLEYVVVVDKSFTLKMIEKATLGGMVVGKFKIDAWVKSGSGYGKFKVKLELYRNDTLLGGAYAAAEYIVNTTEKRLFQGSIDFDIDDTVFEPNDTLKARWIVEACGIEDTIVVQFDHNPANEDTFVLIPVRRIK